jgi:hypothetical protein
MLQTNKPLDKGGGEKNFVCSVLRKSGASTSVKTKATFRRGEGARLSIPGLTAMIATHDTLAREMMTGQAEPKGHHDQTADDRANEESCEDPIHM